MVTYNQLIKNCRISKKKKINKILTGRPSVKAVCKKITTTTPRRPNSANRAIAKVITSNNKLVTVYIPGEKHNLQEHSVVLIQGGGAKDLPSIKYSVVRGILDTSGVNRSTSRSKYGCKKK